MNYKETILPREEKITETIENCKAAYFGREQANLLTYGEFLWTQLRYTRKRWWVLQAALLFLAFRLIPNMVDYYYRVRSMGVIGCLFVVLMIPELWRNREADSMQVEAACLYSLRQVYAARITLFGVADVALVTCFSIGLGSLGFTLTEVLAQFLLPVTVTACICFFLLCGRQNWNETVSLAGCLLFGAAWWLLMMNEQIYTMIVPGVWALLLGLALILLAVGIRRTIQTTNRVWEVDYYGITTA